MIQPEAFLFADHFGQGRLIVREADSGLNLKRLVLRLDVNLHLALVTVL